MSLSSEAREFVGILRNAPEGVVLLSQLLESVEKGLVPKEAALHFFESAATYWKTKIELGLPAGSTDVAVRSLRAVAGNAHGFPGRRPIASESMGPTRYIIQDYHTLTEFHFDVQKLVTNTPIAMETCSPAEFSNAAARMFGEIKELAKQGVNMVRPNASLGSPVGVLWSTHVPPDASRPGIPIANEVRNRMGLVDSSWEYGRALFCYAIDSDDLQSSHRPTPVEGGNKRFRLQPHKATYFNPFGATVDLKLLKDSVADGGRIDDDGVAECVGRPIKPSPQLWNALIRDLAVIGAMSMSTDQPDVSEEHFQDRVLLAKGKAVERVDAFLSRFESDEP